MSSYSRLCENSKALPRVGREVKEDNFDEFPKKLSIFDGTHAKWRLVLVLAKIVKMKFDRQCPHKHIDPNDSAMAPKWVEVPIVGRWAEVFHVTRDTQLANTHNRKSLRFLCGATLF